MNQIRFCIVLLSFVFFTACSTNSSNHALRWAEGGEISTERMVPNNPKVRTIIVGIGNGFAAPVSFVVSLFEDEYTIYQPGVVHQKYYNLGYLVGLFLIWVIIKIINLLIKWCRKPSPRSSHSPSCL